MDCKGIKDLISLYIDKKLEGQELSDFNKHVSGCPECRKLLDETVRTVIS